MEHGLCLWKKNVNYKWLQTSAEKNIWQSLEWLKKAMIDFVHNSLYSNWDSTQYLLC
jgi:hypothetical protein